MSQDLKDGEIANSKKKKILTFPPGVVKVKFKGDGKTMLVKLVNSYRGSEQERFSSQFLQQSGENRRFNAYLDVGKFVDKTAMLTIFVVFQTGKKIWRS